MKKVVLFLFIGFASIADHSYGFSPGRPAYSQQYDVIKNLGIREFVKLSAKQFSELTGTKMSAGDRLSFAIVKMQMKHALKKHPELQVKDFPFFKKKSTVKRVLFWIILGALLLIFLFILIFGLGPR